MSDPDKGQPIDLDARMADSVIVRNLERIMRDGQPKTLEQACAELLEMGVDRVAVDAAADMIRQKAEQVRDAQVPKAVVAGTVESWYFGPRAADRYWPALVGQLRGQGWPQARIDELDQSSSKVVAYLPNPAGDGEYHCRGLVLGYVQSGKTSNFTAVIAKAADAGYRLVVVLSGLHDALRWQTQDRLNTQLWQLNTDYWNRLTDEGDFSPTHNVDALLANTQQRTLAVVKKNGPRLRAFTRWLGQARHELLAKCPVLVIDDEADQASVNTSKPDATPTTINRLIRTLVNKSPRSAYVGYTATPFANVLIDPENYQDLYPRDFIVDLPHPDNYLGPEALFGREPLEHDSDTVDDGHDLIRTIPDPDIDLLRPKGAAARHDFQPVVAESLDQALRYFILSTAARRVRAQGSPHATALVHTSQHVAVHESTARTLQTHLAHLAARLAADDQDLTAELHHQWQAETTAVTAQEFDLPPVTWEQLEGSLADVAASIGVVTDNSRSTERLSFDHAKPRAVVAVGGNTLSRGLTLEGLSVSYFLRTASAYDTLLQMGRWFGYRAGYADVTRIWLTTEMREWFRHLATVEHEIRQEIDRYDTGHETPEQLGVRIRTHPKMAITAAAKMQSARLAKASYSGRRLQTILFNHRDENWLNRNLNATRALLEATATAPHRPGPHAGVTLIGPVPSEQVTAFLNSTNGYQFHENSRDLNADLITRYILARSQDRELTHFTIAVMGRSTREAALGDVDLGAGLRPNRINRARLKDTGRSYADIKALMSDPDRYVDLAITPQQWRALSSDQRVSERGATQPGLLLFYPISPASRPDPRSHSRTALDAVTDVIGVGLVFPETGNTSASVEYVTANVSPGTDVESPDDDDEPADTDETPPQGGP